MARLYANENFPQPVVETLRRLGHDILTTHDTGVIEMSASARSRAEQAVRRDFSAGT